LLKDWLCRPEAGIRRESKRNRAGLKQYNRFITRILIVCFEAIQDALGEK
jgi:hypothetical protein